MRKDIVILGLIILLLSIGCIGESTTAPTPIPLKTTTSAPSRTEEIPLMGKVWKLHSLDGEPAIADKLVSLEFKEDGNIGGTAGCNHYFSSYEIDGATLSFGVVGSTEMYCNEEGVMDQEFKYLKTLGSITGYIIDGTNLKMLDVDGRVLMQFK